MKIGCVSQVVEHMPKDEVTELLGSQVTSSSSHSQLELKSKECNSQQSVPQAQCDASKNKSLFFIA
jgi:hypothetical protein